MSEEKKSNVIILDGKQFRAYKMKHRHVRKDGTINEKEYQKLVPIKEKQPRKKKIPTVSARARLKDLVHGLSDKQCEDLMKYHNEHQLTEDDVSDLDL